LLKGRRPVTSEPLAVMLPAALFRIFYNRQTVLGADEVAAPAQGESRADEVSELPCMVKRRAVPDDMRMDVRTVLSRGS